MQVNSVLHVKKAKKRKPDFETEVKQVRNAANKANLLVSKANGICE